MKRRKLDPFEVANPTIRAARRYGKACSRRGRGLLNTNLSAEAFQARLLFEGGWWRKVIRTMATP